MIPKSRHGDPIVIFRKAFHVLGGARIRCLDTETCLQLRKLRDSISLTILNARRICQGNLSHTKSPIERGNGQVTVTKSPAKDRNPQATRRNKIIAVDTVLLMPKMDLPESTNTAEKVIPRFQATFFCNTKNTSLGRLHYAIPYQGCYPTVPADKIDLSDCISGQ